MAFEALYISGDFHSRHFHVLWLCSGAELLFLLLSFTSFVSPIAYFISKTGLYVLRNVILLDTLMCVDWKYACCNFIINLLPVSTDWMPFETAVAYCLGWLLRSTMSLTNVIGLWTAGRNASTQMVFWVLPFPVGIWQSFWEAHAKQFEHLFQG